MKRLQEYVRIAAPEHPILKLVGEESRSKGTDRLSLREIDRIIKDVRAARARRKRWL